MASFHHFSDIQAWRLARELAAEVYRATGSGAAERDFAFRDQWRRAAISVMNNIAEGFARGTDGQFVQFLNFARGSLAEVESMVFLGEDLGYVSPDVAMAMRQRIDAIAAMIAKLTTYLRSSVVREDAPLYTAEATSGLPDFRTSGLSP